MPIPPPRSSPARIIIAMPQDYRFGREMILGAAKYCGSHNMHLLQFGSGVFDPRSVQAVGMIGYASQPELANQLKKLGVPIVNTSSRYPVTEVPSVLFDNRAIGKLAAEHLIERGFSFLAYTGITGHWYSTLRGEGFTKAAKDAGVACDSSGSLSYDLLNNPTGCTLAKWLVALPKPVGLMTCNDIRSHHVVELCRVLNIRIPEDIALIGVDNEEVICQATEPGLTSIEPDAFRVGYEAAAMLNRLIQNKPVQSPTLVPPIGVVPRGSTNTFATNEPTVAEALSIIYRNASEPIGVSDVAAKMGISRRTLERRFLAAVGGSVADTIRLAHIEKAKQLLIDTELSLDEIAEASGFRYARQLRIAFLKNVKTLPSQFRRTFKISV